MGKKVGSELWVGGGLQVGGRGGEGPGAAGWGPLDGGVSSRHCPAMCSWAAPQFLSLVSLSPASGPCFWCHGAKQRR